MQKKLKNKNSMTIEQKNDTMLLKSDLARTAISILVVLMILTVVYFLTK